MKAHDHKDAGGVISELRRAAPPYLFTKNGHSQIQRIS